MQFEPPSPQAVAGFDTVSAPSARSTERGAGPGAVGGVRPCASIDVAGGLDTRNPWVPTESNGRCSRPATASDDSARWPLGSITTTARRAAQKRRGNRAATARESGNSTENSGASGIERSPSPAAKLAGKDPPAAHADGVPALGFAAAFGYKAGELALREFRTKHAHHRRG